MSVRHRHSLLLAHILYLLQRVMESNFSSLRIRRGELSTASSEKRWQKSCLPSLDIDYTIPQEQLRGKTSQSERIRANIVRYDSDMLISMRMSVAHSDPNTPAHSSSLSGLTDALPARPYTALAPIRQQSNQRSQDVHEIGHNKFARRVLSAPPARLKARNMSMIIIQPKQHESSRFSVPMHRIKRFLRSSGGFRSFSPSDPTRNNNHRPANLLRDSFKSTSRNSCEFETDKAEVERALVDAKDFLLRND